MAGEVKDGGGKGEADDDIDEVVVAKVNGGKPKAHAGDHVQTEAPPFVPVIEEKHVGRDGAVKTGENVDTITAVADHGSVPMREGVAGERGAEFVRHGKVGAGGGYEGIAEETDAVNGEQAEIKAFEKWKRFEEILEHAESEIGNEKHVTEAEGFGEEWANMGFEAKAKILADEGVVHAAKRRVEKRAAMDRVDHGGHEFIGQVHDHGVVEEPEAPGPLGSDARRQPDKKSGDEQEGKIKQRERAGETGRTDETKPGDKKEELEDVFVGKKAERKRDSSLRGLSSE